MSKLKELREQAEKKVESLDIDILGYVEWSKEWDKAYVPYRRELRKDKLKREFVLSEISEHADHMTMEEFIDYCECGGFIDSDGQGNYATKDQESDISIKPSDITSGVYRKDFTHVCWYNK